MNYSAIFFLKKINKNTIIKMEGDNMCAIIGGYLTPHAPILIKEIGKGEERKAQKTIDSMKEISQEIKNIKPDTVVVITPHGNFFRDSISINLNKNLEGDFEQFGNRNIKLEFDNDLEAAEKIINLAEKNNIEVYGFSKEKENSYRLNHKLDHGTLVPLYFIANEYNDFNVVHINYALFPGEKLYEFGKLIKSALEELSRKTIVIASGDLSHRLSKDSYNGYTPEGEIFDKKLLGQLENKEIDEIINFDKKLSEKAGECGLRSLQLALGTFSGLNIETKIYSYEGPFGVGYGCAKINVLKKNKDDYVELAKKTVEHFLENNEKLKLPNNLNSEELYNKKAGAFVTLKKKGELRGCIGTIFPVKEKVGEEIIENAVSSAFRDPRFYPVKEEELDEIEYSVDVLEEPEEVKSKDELDPYKYGVIVTKGSRKGVLLPNLEGVETVEKQLDIALRKAGINSDENYKIEKFRVIRHKEN